jgi:multidrug transporter EmrE-like cation transporter
MKEPWIALIAVLCNVGAQVSMKHAGQLQLAARDWMSWINPWLIASVVLYGASFLLTVRIFAVNSLSVASPAMAGATFLLVTLCSWLLYGEPMSAQKVAGISLIFTGIVLLARV